MADITAKDVIDWFADRANAREAAIMVTEICEENEDTEKGIPYLTVLHRALADIKVCPIYTGVHPND